MSSEEICEYNGQTVRVDESGSPLTFHDCGYADCPLCWQRKSKSSLNMHNESDNWERVSEYWDNYIGECE